MREATPERRNGAAGTDGEKARPLRQRPHAGGDLKDGRCHVGEPVRVSIIERGWQCLDSAIRSAGETQEGASGRE